MLEYSAINPKVTKRLLLEEEWASRQYIRGCDVYMIIWKSLIGECLQCVKKSTKKKEKNTVAVVRTNSHYKEEVVGHVQQKSPWLYPCFYPCPIVLWTSLQLVNAWTIEVNTDWKSLQIFIFVELKSPLNWLKNKITKIKKKVEWNCKTLSKVKCIQISDKKCLIWLAVGHAHFREVSSRESGVLGT